MQIMLLNDTGLVSHVGCQGVSDAHARMLGRAGHHVTQRYFIGQVGRFRDVDPKKGLRRVLADDDFMRRLNAVDAVVVNGEGTIHHAAGTEYLNVLAAAHKLGKATLLVNCVLEGTEGFDHVFRAIDDIVVRDSRSARWLEARGRRPRVIPDSFVEAQFDPQPILDLAGQVPVTDWHHERDADTGAASLRFLRHPQPLRAFFLPLMCGNIAPHWRHVPATMKTAPAVVTGRHHGVYCAVLAGVPFVALSSNTHKVAGLLEDVPELMAFLDPPSIADAVAAARGRPDAFRRLEDMILGQRPLATFSLLGTTPDGAGEAREIARLSRDVEAASGGLPADLAYRIQRRSAETGQA